MKHNFYKGDKPDIKSLIFLILSHRYDDWRYIGLNKMATAFIEIDKPFYFAGDTVQGQVYLNLFENIIANEVLIKFKGWESVRWFE